MFSNFHIHIFIAVVVPVNFIFFPSFAFLYINMLKVLQDPFKKRLAVSYLWDWVLVIIMTAAFFAIDQITPFHRMFSLEDKTIMFPYAEKESVPVWMLLVCIYMIVR